MGPTSEAKGAPGSRQSYRWLAGAALGVVLVTATACGSGGASSSTSTKPGGSTQAKSAVFAVAASQRGSFGMILTDQSGRTLYRFAPDGTGTPTCTGSCATVWPPLTVTAGTVHVTGISGVTSSDLGTVTRSGGVLQVTFKGMPLYRFSGDAKPGDTNGQGLGGTWFVVPTAASPAVPASTTTSQSQATTTAPPAPVTNRPSPAPMSPAATAPPVTAPPVTAPPATAPPTTPATAPPATAPPATQPGGGGYGY